MDKKFVELYFEGINEFSDLDQIISDCNLNEDSEIAQYLGLTESEYNLYKSNEKITLENILKAKKFKIEIINKAKDFFKQEIAASHEQNTTKLNKLSAFNLNPFLDKYKANFLTGNNSPESIAKALIYPRVLGTSINTTFGNKMQKFCSTVLEGFASTTSGIDIEFLDFIDGRKKYCQIKAGPNTINKDDVQTIENHFRDIKNLARTNNLDVRLSDLVIGVFYGESSELSGHYKNLSINYSVYIGKEFWHRLTGDEDFYQQLANAIGDVATEYDSSQLLENVISELAEDIRNNNI